MGFAACLLACVLLVAVAPAAEPTPKVDRAGRATELTGAQGGVSPQGVSPSGTIAASKDLLYVPQGTRMPAAFRRSDGKLMWWNTRGDSDHRSNINVQNYGGSDLALGGGLLFIGGPDQATGTNKKFIAAAGGKLLFTTNNGEVVCVGP